MTSAISITELDALESTVRRGMSAFIEVGTALKAIRASHGYRLRGYATFEDYCKTEFGFSLRHGQRFITSADTAKAVHMLTGASITTESVARELTQVTMRQEARAELHAIFNAIRSKGKSLSDATAKDIRAQLAFADKGKGDAIKLVWPQGAPTIASALVEHVDATCSTCTHKADIGCRYCPLVRFLQRVK